MPPRPEPGVDYRRLAELAEEFSELWKRLQAFYLDASVGFAFVRQWVKRTQDRAQESVRGTELDSEEFQDLRIFSYAEILSGEFVTSGIHDATQGDARARNLPHGQNANTLGALCLVAFYGHWNDHLRVEYVRAKGKLSLDEKDEGIIRQALIDHGSHALWGDIRLIRNSIVHNRGFATEDIIRCKLIPWFSPGDRIELSPDKMKKLFMALLAFRNELHAEQFPPHFITLGRS